MAKSPFSQNWYRVSDLTPRLRSHATIHRQRFRGDTWYILQDNQSGRYHRISPSANLMLNLMDGRRTVRDIWQAVADRAKDEPPTQDETIQLLGQLHAADLLTGETPPDIAELAERARETADRALMQKLRNPLALRMPLFDPDRMLNALVPLFRLIYTVPGFLLWLGVVIAGVVLAVMHWQELTADVVTQALSAQNLLILAAVYPLIKLVHELGHASATKVWGGQLHEFGIMLLVLIPVPYVDASASAAFQQKWKRLVVSGAGIMVELLLAAIAMIVWVNAEPGMVRAIAFNVMLIGGLSTLLFNGNPLLRFDGYYIFADLIEIPNLGTRSNKYFFHVVQKYLFGVEDQDSPVTHPSERKWLFGYAVLAAIYRVGVSLGIASFVATQLFFVGIAIAIYTLFQSFILPAFKGLGFVFSNGRLNGHRTRSVLVTTGAVGLIFAILFAIPLPYATVAQGVVWVPEGSMVRSGTDGVVQRVAALDGATVLPGTPLVRLDDPIIDAQVSVLEAQRAEYTSQLDAVRAIDPVQVRLIEGQLNHIEGRLAAFAERKANLDINSPTDGRLLLQDGNDLVGRYVRRGDLVGYVVGADDPVLRVVVPQAQIDVVRARRGPIDIRFAGDLETIRPAEILREAPAAQRNIPSATLTTEGGGEILIDPRDPNRSKALEGLFFVDLRIADGKPVDRLGERVFVRFDHGTEPIAFRLLRSLRQIFLSRFGL
jgi:putative peptide zinc metalloprotease protein